MVPRIEPSVVIGPPRRVGPALSGGVADRIGFRPALLLAYLVQAAAVAAPIVASGPLALAVSSFVVGAFTPGITTLVLGRLRELVPLDPLRQRAAWGWTVSGLSLRGVGAGRARAA